MKRTILLLTVFICCGVISNAQKKVAVYVTGDQEQAIKKVLGSKMVTYITDNDGFTAVERTADFLSALSSEHDYQASGEVSNSQIIKLGQQFGAGYVAVVDVSELFGELFISARMIDVMTSQVIASFEASDAANNMSDLTSLANKVADGLILAPERKQKEREQQRVAQEQADLRARAIKNLTPANAIICGSYIVVNRLFPVSVDSYCQLSYDALPIGFKIADAGVIEYILKLNSAECKDFQEMIKGKDFVTGIYDESWRNEKAKQSGTDYYYYYTKVYSSGGLYNRKGYSGVYTYNEKSGTTSYSPKQIYDRYIIAYRDMFTESEIQAEIERLSK